MANYFLGDIQGCFDELQALLTTIDFDPGKDTLWFTGDLVARGPKSLETLRFVRALGDAGRTVLGNHDIHLLAVHAGIKTAKPADHLAPLLTAPDCDELIHWLRRQPLLIELAEFQLLLCHAGIPPQWDSLTAATCAREVESLLQSDDYLTLISQMYSNDPALWQASLAGIERQRYTINALTRMRFCHRDGRLNLNDKCAPSQQTNPDLLPWFELPGPSLASHRVVFGHWASLMGQASHDAAIALDTGCLWGNHLTAWRVEDNRRFIQKTLV